MSRAARAASSRTAGGLPPGLADDPAFDRDRLHRRTLSTAAIEVMLVDLASLGRPLAVLSCGRALALELVLERHVDQVAIGARGAVVPRGLRRRPQESGVSV
jgi:hypothetical protein